jgi:hypothetical protein
MVLIETTALFLFNKKPLDFYTVSLGMSRALIVFCIPQTVFGEIELSDNLFIKPQRAIL